MKLGGDRFNLFGMFRKNSQVAAILPPSPNKVINPILDGVQYIPIIDEGGGGGLRKLNSKTRRATILNFCIRNAFVAITHTKFYFSCC